jgi:hypothetical protein
MDSLLVLNVLNRNILNLDPPYHAADPEALKNARPDRQEPLIVPVGNPKPKFIYKQWNATFSSKW